MLPINRLKEQSSSLFFRGSFEEGHRVAKQCVELEPHQAQHYVNKAVFECRLGNVKTALSDLNKAISLDYLNYQAYFNLFSIQIQGEDYESAFKNICCCLSVLHLLRAEKEGSQEEIEKAIDYSFNNKEARLFKSILKMEEKKNIEALNQINYALYLDPSHDSLKIVQEKVYRLMGMKELKTKGTQSHKQKYDRLETNKEVPPPGKIKGEIEKLLKEFNRLVKTIDCEELYKVKSPPKEVMKVLETPAETPKIIKPRFYLAENKVAEQQCEESNFAQETTMKFKEDKASTANNSEHIEQASRQQALKPTIEGIDKNEPFFMMDSSFENLSISNISQNSNIKMNRMKANYIDFVDASKSNDSIGSILESSISEEGGGELKIPLALNELKQNERIVVTLQRTAVNQRGETEKIEELYQVVENNNKLELVKIVKE